MTGFKWNRENFIPKGAVKVVDKKSDAIAYVKPGVQRNGKTYTHVVVFCANRQKPDLNAIYSNEKWMQKQVNDIFESRQRHTAYMAEKKAKAAAPRSVEVGTVLVGSFGYEQTNVVAYEVVGLVGAHSVKLRQISTRSVETTGSMSGYVIPNPGDFCDDKVVTKRVTDGNRISMSSYLSIRPWDGRKLYESSYA